MEKIARLFSQLLALTQRVVEHVQSIRKNRKHAQSRTNRKMIANKSRKSLVSSTDEQYRMRACLRVVDWLTLLFYPTLLFNICSVLVCIFQSAETNLWPLIWYVHLTFGTDDFKTTDMDEQILKHRNINFRIMPIRSHEWQTHNWRMCKSLSVTLLCVSLKECKRRRITTEQIQHCEWSKEGRGGGCYFGLSSSIYYEIQWLN